MVFLKQIKQKSLPPKKNRLLLILQKRTRADITICCADNAEDISSPLEIKETAEDVKAESEKSDADDLNVKTDDVDE